jgi:hypothetical protein
MRAESPPLFRGRGLPPGGWKKQAPEDESKDDQDHQPEKWKGRPHSRAEGTNPPSPGIIRGQEGKTEIIKSKTETGDNKGNPPPAHSVFHFLMLLSPFSFSAHNEP